MTRKIAISLPDHLVEAAQKAVSSGRAASVSAYVAEALGERVRADEQTSVITEILMETGGPLTDEERARIDKDLGW